MGRHVKNKIGGHIRPRPNKANPTYFEINIELGVNELNGKRERATFKARTREEAEILLLEKKLEYQKGKLLTPDTITVKQYLKLYFSTYVDGKLSPATQVAYWKSFESYIIPTMGHMQLQQLRTIHIQQCYNEWRESSPANKGNPLSTATIKLHHRHFRAALQKAIDLGFISSNPACKAKVIERNVTQKKNHVYSKEEFYALQQAVQGTDMELIVALLFDCLLRREELLGLQWSDVNLESGEISVKKALVTDVDGKSVILSGLKTKSSYRTMKLSQHTLGLLKRHNAYHKAMKMQNGNSWNGNNFVICKEDGEQFLPHSMTQKWIRTLKKHGLRHIKLHGTRHSGITFLIEQGVPINVAQRRAGHADPSMTLAVYTGITPATESLAAETFDNVLFNQASDSSKQSTKKVVNFS